MALQQPEAVLAGGRAGGTGPFFQRPDLKHRYDLKKILLVGGLAALSWMSTFTGMLELVQANLGDLDFIFKVAIGCSVAMLMLMVVWLLDQLFNESTTLTVRMLYIAGYLLLTLISVGFSFGFYWKFLESRSEASRGAESAVTQVESSLHGAEMRLAQMQSVFDTLAAVSSQKATEESTKGNSCPNSRPGDGPRRRLRDADAASFSTASQFVQQRAASIKGDIASLDADLQKIVHQDKSTFDAKTGTRNEYMKALGRKMGMTVAGFNAFRTDPQLKQLRADFAERADKTTFPDDNGKTFSCPDAQIQAALHSAVKSIDALPVLEKPEIVTVEGADATIEAFRRLNVSLMSLAQFKLPATPDQIRSEQARAVQTGGAADPKATPSEAEAGLSQRDYIPLAIALFVDLCLLLVSIPKPLSPTERTRRRRAEADGEIYRTLDDLYAIHDDPDARAKMEPLRHIAFDYMGHDYVAVPLIASREGAGGDHDGSARNLADDDMLEAQFIANFFASQESGGPFRRASFPPANVVRARLKKLGSKWAGIQSFRVYRFGKGAWSDFVLDMVVGADHELTPVRRTQLDARIKKNEMKSGQIVFESELKEIEHEAVKSAKRKEAELNTLMIETNIGAKQQEADLRRREMSAQSELNTLGLEATITAKRVEIERARREITRASHMEEREVETLSVVDGFDLKAEGGAARKMGFWDKFLGGKDEQPQTEPSLERKPRRQQAAPEPQLPPSPDLKLLRETVSELAIIMRDLATHQAAQAALAARTAAASKPGAEAGALRAAEPAGSRERARTSGPAGVRLPDAQPFEIHRHANGHTETLHGFEATSAAGKANGRPSAEAEAGGTVPDKAPIILMPGPLHHANSEPHWPHYDSANGGGNGDATAEPWNGSHNGDAIASGEASDDAASVVRFPDAFRWAAESTMAGGLHQIDQAIEPMVSEAIEVSRLPDQAPELLESWHMSERLTHARQSEDEDYADRPAAAWAPGATLWPDVSTIEGDDGDEPEIARKTGEDPELTRIATKFGRASSRRRRSTENR